MEAGKFCDAYGLMDCHGSEQADASQAYTQTFLKGDETWIELPHAEVEKLRKTNTKWTNLRKPVCRLTLALYGHPDAGGYREEHATKHLVKCGFEEIYR